LNVRQPGSSGSARWSLPLLAGIKYSARDLVCDVHSYIPDPQSRDMSHIRHSVGLIDVRDPRGVKLHSHRPYNYRLYTVVPYTVDAISSGIQGGPKK